MLATQLEEDHGRLTVRLEEEERARASRPTPAAPPPAMVPSGVSTSPAGVTNVAGARPRQPQGRRAPLQGRGLEGLGRRHGRRVLPEEKPCLSSENVSFTVGKAYFY